MIITFHVALYLAYRLWENYVSLYFADTEVNDTNDVEQLNNDPTLNANPDSHSITAPEPEGTEVNNRNIPNVTFEPNSGQISSLSHNGKNQQMEDTNDIEQVINNSTFNIISDSHSFTASEPEGTEINSHNEPNVTFEPNSGPSSSLSHNGKNQQMEEGYGDTHSCLYDANDTFDDSDNGKIKPIDQLFSCIYKEGKEIRFVPPAYTQRYMVIQDVLKEQQWRNVKKVVDFGCAELSFEVTYLKKLFNIQEIVAVDIDFEKIDYNKCKLIPNAVDHIQPRPTPLTVKIYQGSVGHTNEVLKGADAVIAIELIEHLYPHDLECLPFTVFAFIRPNIAMFTTPNADFNVLFPDFSGMRHWDHKFEWTREQFEDWGNNLVKRYPEYNVSYRGITPGPPGAEHLGCLSQMATFTKIRSAPPLDEDELQFQEGSYELAQETVFPYYEDKRTYSEIIRDDAVSFIQNYAMLCRYSNDYSDEDRRLEIPLKHVMDRIKCYNRKKLIAILTGENYEIGTNSDGYEVLILPADFEDENESSQGDFCDDSSTDLVCQLPDANCEDTVIADENWDCDWNNEPQEITVGVAFLAAESAFNEKNLSSNITHNVMSTKFEKQESNCKELDKSYEPLSSTNTDIGLFTSLNVSGSDNSNNEMLLEKAQHENLTVDESLVHSLCNNLSLDSLIPDSSVESSCLKDEGAELDYSVYETPFHNCFRTSSKSELFHPSVQSLYHNESTPHGDCKKELSFDTPSTNKETHPVSDLTNSKTDLTKLNNVCSMTNVISSPFESSYYATPSCSHIHKTCIPKCLSLQQFNDGCDSSFFDYESGKCLTSSVKGEKKDNISKSMDGFKSHENFDIHETCSNTSRVIDSGYPDSYSEHNMDLDSTQFDDIETQSEGGDLSSRLPSPVEPLAPPLPQRVVDDVENGDVANNNRDGEGNNMVADMEEDFFEFEAQIEEVEMPNLALPLDSHLEQKVMLGDYLLDAPPSLFEINGSISNSPDLSHLFPQNNSSKISNPLKEFPFNEECYDVYNNKTADQQTMKSAQSDSSIATKSSWSHLDSSDSMADVGLKQENQINIQCNHPKIGGHNSLTTVLEGCSKFSDCSLVCPVDTSSSNNEDQVESYGFPKWMLNIDCSLFHAGEDIRRNHSSDSIKTFHLHPSQCHLSSPSLYQSLSSTPFESDGEDNIGFYFPRWLLDIQVSETEESNVEVVSSDVSVWDVESDNDLVRVPFDVQVDARGGGDPQRDSWFD